MTTAPTSASAGSPTGAVAADVTPIDLAARGPLLFLIGSGIVWLVISGILALITSIQLHSPRFLGEHSFLTYGRLDAMRETAFVYGWAANAGLALAVWILGRLGGNLLRALNWAFAGAAFWNTGLTIGLIGIAMGDMTSFSLFELPRYAQPIMVISYGAISISGVLAWIGRRRDVTFAAQWYAVAALFLFPWLSSVAQLVLLWAPSRGVAQNIAAAWCTQGMSSLWLAPLALAGAYYLVARQSSRALPNYDSAPLGFWALIFVGAWTGGRQLIGGPVPAWIPTVAVVAAVVLLIHYLVVALNLRTGWAQRGPAAAFIRFGVVAYLLAGALDVITAFRGIAVHTQFTFFTSALEQLALYGGVSMIFFGAIYFMVPRLTGHDWASTSLATGHRWLVMLGVVVLVLTLGIAGWVQGAALLNPKVPFAEIVANAKLPLLVISAAQFVLLAANLLLLVNFLQSITRSVVTDVLALNPIQETSEVSAT